MKYSKPVFAIFVTAFIVCLIIAGIIALYWKAFVLNYVEKEFRAALKGYSVRIGGRAITPHTLAFSNIDIATRHQQFLKIRDFRLHFTILSLFRDRAAGFSIEETVLYDKLKIPKVHGVATYLHGVLMLDDVSVRTLNGMIEGSATIKFGKTPSYFVTSKLKDIELEKIVEIFELNKKIDVTGLVSGAIGLSGEGPALTRLEGKLETSPKGGMLTIKNKEWLDAIARYAKQDVNMVVDNFKNYHYNEGNATLGLKGTSIIADAHLGGETGKRDFLISLHDFNVKGR